jgi:hypothetical protein
VSFERIRIGVFELNGLCGFMDGEGEEEGVSGLDDKVGMGGRGRDEMIRADVTLGRSAAENWERCLIRLSMRKEKVIQIDPNAVNQ